MLDDETPRPASSSPCAGSADRLSRIAGLLGRPVASFFERDEGGPAEAQAAELLRAFLALKGREQRAAAVRFVRSLADPATGTSATGTSATDTSAIGPDGGTGDGSR